MESPPPSSDVAGDVLADPSKPFQGVVVCCTSIPPEQRTDVANKTKELGGVHKYDLTPDVTHLVVGEYDTPKYRHVAKERPDIKPMAAGWVDAVLDLWVKDSDIDFAALEKEWALKTFETGSEAGRGVERARLLCCLTGFDDPDVRQKIIEKITANGGGYTGDLTRKVTHLIVCKPEGRKYSAAKGWGIHTVALEWLHDSAERGMVLDEACYDPTLPQEQRGRGAWTKREVQPVSLGKRLRDAAVAPAQEQGRRKLKKTASLKLSSQRENLWGDILGKQQPSTGLPRSDQPPTGPMGSLGERPQTGPPAPSARAAQEGRASLASAPAGGSDQTIFSNCRFYIYGFPAPQTQILASTVTFMGGTIACSLDEILASAVMSGPSSRRFVVVPQNSKPEAHPTLPAGEIEVVTEFYVEKCLHKKEPFPPTEHVIGRPFTRFPIQGFEGLAVCTAGFTGVDLNQVDKSIRQLGATYEERFTPQSSVLLVCSSLSRVRKQKLDLALAWKVPVVRAEWLWDCVRSGRRASFSPYLFQELKQTFVPSEPARLPPNETGPSSDNPQPERVEKGDKVAHAQDTASLNSGGNVALREPDAPSIQDSGVAHIDTDPSQVAATGDDAGGQSGALVETSSDSLNKTPSQTNQRQRVSTDHIQREVGDSEAGEEDEDGVAGDENRSLQAGSGPEECGDADPRQAERETVAAAAAAERRALSTRLTSLLEFVTTASCSLGGDGTDSHLSAGDEMASRPARRRRGIMGRAISNVSAASSGSVDSSVGGQHHGPSKTASATASFALLNEGMLDGENGADSGLSIPAATQIEYDDPEAKKYKAQLMSKMMGTVAEDMGLRSHEERPTLGDGQGLRANASSTTKLGRNMRRRR